MGVRGRVQRMYSAKNSTFGTPFSSSTKSIRILFDSSFFHRWFSPGKKNQRTSASSCLMTVTAAPALNSPLHTTQVLTKGCGHPNPLPMHTVGGLSSKFDGFLAGLSQFGSDRGVDFSTPTCCQSATFVRPFFAFYCSLFFTGGKLMQHFVTDAAMFTQRD